MTDGDRVDWLDWLAMQRWSFELGRTGDGDFVAQLLNGHRRELARGVGKTARAAIDACRLVWERTS